MKSPAGIKQSLWLGCAQVGSRTSLYVFNASSDWRRVAYCCVGLAYSCIGLAYSCVVLRRLAYKLRTFCAKCLRRRYAKKLNVFIFLRSSRVPICVPPRTVA